MDNKQDIPAVAWMRELADISWYKINEAGQVVEQERYLGDIADRYEMMVVALEQTARHWRCEGFDVTAENIECVRTMRKYFNAIFKPLKAKNSTRKEA